MFTNRTEAGKRIAQKLKHLLGANAVVLALPRGGVVVGYEIAKMLQLPLDIVVTRKIGHPSNPEYAICAVDEKGNLICNEEEKEFIDKSWLKEEIERQKKEVLRRLSLYRGGNDAIEIKGKDVILADDGVATGLTMRLAILAVRKQKPARIIVAVPVASIESIGELKEAGADEIIVLEPPAEFLGSVGSHYQQFEQVEDEEVIDLLRAIRTP